MIIIKNYMNVLGLISQLIGIETLRLTNFTNLKTPGGYIVKSKPQGVGLQLSQTPGGDYAF